MPESYTADAMLPSAASARANIGGLTYSLRFAIAGNPNCGKTTLFNALTGARQQVGNWPGVTVDRKVGFYTHEEIKVELVDTPGIYSLSAASLDEEVTRNFPWVNPRLCRGTPTV